MVIQLLFWISVIFVIYTYIGYPFIAFLISLIKSAPAKRKEIMPTVSLIIAAYNEEAAIDEKIKNSLSLDYPRDKFEIIVGSDCSTDKTDEIVSRYKEQGVKLVRLKKRGGKTVVQNTAVKEARGEILVFSDATTIYEKDAIKKLIRNFNNPSVGGAGGRLVFVDSFDKVLGSELQIHRKTEQSLKEWESKIRAALGFDGCIYALRRELYEPFDWKLTSDFLVALRIIEKGYRAIYESGAIAYEDAALTVRGEFKRKIRTCKGGMTTLWNMKKLLNPFKWGFVSFALISHKLFRWLVPFFLFAGAFSNTWLFNVGLIYKFGFIAQCLFYGCAMIGYPLAKRRTAILKIFIIPFYFCMLNIAAIFGVVQFIFGNNGAIWETERTDGQCA